MKPPFTVMCIKQDSYDADTGEVLPSLLSVGNYYTVVGFHNGNKEYYWLKGIAKHVFHFSLFGLPSEISEADYESQQVATK